MMHTIYTFTKNNQSYSTRANNRFEAQREIELTFQIDLTGATYEETYKLRTVRTGIVK